MKCGGAQPQPERRRREADLAAVLLAAACRRQRRRERGLFVRGGDLLLAFAQRRERLAQALGHKAEIFVPTISALRACATTGNGAVAGDTCFLLTPAESGLPAAGHRAGIDQYALRPTASARGKLVVFFNGSGGGPAAGPREIGRAHV